MKKQVVLSLFLLSALVLSVFLIGSVSAENYFQKALGSIASSFNTPSETPASGSLFASFFSLGTSDTAFVKFLLFFLVACMVYAVSPFVPILSDNKFVTWAVTLIVAYLATYAISIQEINTILLSYNAMGLLLTGILPFLLVFAISKRLHDSGNVFGSKFLWVAFFILIGYKLASATVGTIPLIMLWAYFVLLLIALVMFIWETKIFNKMYRLFAAKGSASKYKKQAIDEMNLHLASLYDRMSSVRDPKLAASIQKEIDEIVERIEEMK